MSTMALLGMSQSCGSLVFWKVGDVMSRLLWVGIGAAGGIYTYRRGQRAWDRAKERGWSGTASILMAATASALQTARLQLIEQDAIRDSQRQLTVTPTETTVNRAEARRSPETIPASRSSQSLPTVTLG